MKFPMGQVLRTAGVSRLLTGAEATALLDRHAKGDWGDADLVANTMALRDGGDLLSVYEVRGLAVWIITEANRSATTVLFPEER